MAVETDDPDIRPAWMYTDVGGNGDYYLHIVEIKDLYNKEGKIEKQVVLTSMRLSTSGSAIPFEVRTHITALYREMQARGLNEYPDKEIQETLARLNKDK